MCHPPSSFLRVLRLFVVNLGEDFTTKTQRCRESTVFLVQASEIVKEREAALQVRPAKFSFLLGANLDHGTGRQVGRSFRF